MVSFFGDEPPVDDWMPDEDDIRVVCPDCSSGKLDYKGEAWDDDFFIGSRYQCRDCGSRFSIMEADLRDY